MRLKSSDAQGLKMTQLAIAQLRLMLIKNSLLQFKIPKLDKTMASLEFYCHQTTTQVLSGIETLAHGRILPSIPWSRNIMETLNNLETIVTTQCSYKEMLIQMKLSLLRLLQTTLPH
jgi:hypothetical protein